MDPCHKPSHSQLAVVLSDHLNRQREAEEHFAEAARLSKVQKAKGKLASKQPTSPDSQGIMQQYQELQRHAGELRRKLESATATNKSLQSQNALKAGVRQKPGQSLGPTSKEKELEARCAHLEERNEMLESEVEIVEMLSSQIGDLQAGKTAAEEELAVTKQKLMELNFESLVEVPPN